MTDKATQPPLLPPWKASFLSDKIIPKKKDCLSILNTPTENNICYNFIPICETTNMRSMRASLSYRTPGSRLSYSEPYPFVPKLITILLFVAVVPEPVHVCPKGV